MKRSMALRNRLLFRMRDIVVPEVNAPLQVQRGPKHGIERQTIAQEAERLIVVTGQIGLGGGSNCCSYSRHDPDRLTLHAVNVDLLHIVAKDQREPLRIMRHPQAHAGPDQINVLGVSDTGRDGIHITVDDIVEVPMRQEVEIHVDVECLKTRNGRAVGIKLDAGRDNAQHLRVAPGVLWSSQLTALPAEDLSIMALGSINDSCSASPSHERQTPATSKRIGNADGRFSPGKGPDQLLEPRARENIYRKGIMGIV